MGIFDIFKKSNTNVNSNIYCPVKGKVIPLNQIPDDVFSQGILGDGIGVEPQEGIIYAPADCTVIQIADTKHAIGLNINDIDLLIHVGIDTVSLNGKGFEVFVKENQKVKKGQKILKVDLDLIRSSGYEDVIVVVMTDIAQNKNYKIMEYTNLVTNNDIIIKL